MSKEVGKAENNKLSKEAFKKAPEIEVNLDNEEKLETNIGKLEEYVETFHTRNKSRIISQIYQILEYCNGDLKPHSFEEHINSFISGLHELQLRDPIETSLATQMLFTHDLFVKCSKKANIKGQHPERIDDNIKNLLKLSRVFTNQLKAYMSYRNQGQQRVKVEHVHVSEGGQAVFGNINTRQKE